jgi:glycosyltransferase involved in cell wall biosynthesis
MSLRARKPRLTGRNIVCFSTADWDTLLPTNKHQLMRRFAARGNRVLFIETLGTRAPALGSATDLARIGRRIGRAFEGPRKREPRLWSISPVVRPGWRTRFQQGLNRAAFTMQVGPVLRQFPKPIVWIYTPYAVHVLPELEPALVVYHLVDDLAAVPGADATAIREAETLLLARADLVFCTERGLYDRVRDVARRAHFMPNVADYRHFARPGENISVHATRMAADPRPKILFSGNIAHHKVDLRLLGAVARAHPEWLVVVAGPVWEGTPEVELAPLRRLPNVLLTGHIPYDEMPSLLHAANVLLIPYLLNEATDAVFPLKFFEYLATGKPVVCTPLPSLLPYEPAVRIAGSAEAFSVAITEALAEPRDYAIARRVLARRHTWARRIVEMEAEMLPLLR